MHLLYVISLWLSSRPQVLIGCTQDGFLDLLWSRTSKYHDRLEFRMSKHSVHFAELVETDVVTTLNDVLIRGIYL